MKTDRLQEKTAAIYLAKKAKADGALSAARGHYGKAALIEDEIWRELAAKRQPDFLVNAISAVACWLEAGKRDKAREVGRAALGAVTGVEPAEQVRELTNLLGNEFGGM